MNVHEPPLTPEEQKAFIDSVTAPRLTQAQRQEWYRLVTEENMTVNEALMKIRGLL